MIALPNISGQGYRVIGGFDQWYSDDPGADCSLIAHQVSLISYGGIKNLVASLVNSDGVLQIEEPPIPADVAFTGDGFTEDNNSDDGYALNIDAKGYAKSTWPVDLTKGLIFRVGDFNNSMVTFCFSQSYWAIPNGTYGKTNGVQQTIVFRNDNGNLRVSLYDGKNEIVPKTYTSIQAEGTHILSVVKYNDYYYFTVDGKIIIMEHIVKEPIFKLLNNYNSSTKTYGGTYFKIYSSKDIIVDSVRAFKKSEEKEVGGWITDTNAVAKQISDDVYDLDMPAYSSLKIKKMANLEKGITFKITESEKYGRFGIAFARSLVSTSLDIPPKNGVGDIYYNFADNNDGTVSITSSDGHSATIALDLTKEHNYGIVEIELFNGEKQYTLSIDGEAVFQRGMDFE